MDCPASPLPDLQPLCDLDLQDNAPALQSRIDHLAERGGGVLHLDPARRAYRSGPLVWRSGVSLAGRDGLALLRQAPGSRRPLIDLTGVTGARFDRLALEGQGPAPGSWASALWSDGACGDLTLRDCRITGWARHGISLDGVTGFDMADCRIEACHGGGGIVLSRGQPGRDITIRHCRIRRTQFGNIHAWGPVARVLVEGNHLEISGWQGGSYASGDVADNITLYGPAENRDIVIRGNLCAGSAENGIHAAAQGLVIEGNILRQPALYGIIVSHKPYDRPAPCGQVVVAGNVIFCPDPANPHSRGIGLRNCTGFSVTGNQIDGAHTGIEVLGMAAPCGAGVIADNVLTGGGAVALQLRGLTARLRVVNNLWQMQTLFGPEGSPIPDKVQAGQNPQV